MSRRLLLCPRGCSCTRSRQACWALAPASCWAGRRRSRTATRNASRRRPSPPARSCRACRHAGAWRPGCRTSDVAAPRVCKPAVVAHYVGEGLSLPLLLAAYARLADRELDELLPSLTFAAFGVVAFAALGAVDDSAIALLSATIGARSLRLAAQVLNGVLPRSPDMQRLYTSQDLFFFGWVLLTGARSLACLGQISRT